ncbi:unnamed protein product [Acanthoscelides obtectus]|uniref:DDE Tnp4 domain-containing protein n=1 Tax=Acanthoscelides obtectus TaxID=200917 RepID=A0A9P0LA00_ACAOB|nr:unnamed protein product [Acanthoscelides obtectus]CAK1621564.1 Putative nuclease HARBI1 [Acanthoscelides obtectus]
MQDSKVKNEDYLETTVPQYSDETFFEHFRVSRNVVNEISGMFQNSEYYRSKSGPYGKLLSGDQVLVYLWYVGHETAGFRDVADRYNISISSVTRILKRLTLFLSNLSPTVIQWPDDSEKEQIEAHFRNNGFPRVIGCIDGSHIKLDKPENDPESYINRKGFYSIQIQAVCDHQRRFKDLFVGYPGSVHDSRVFRTSPLSQTLEQKCGTYFILGDSGYPLQKNLLTPYKDRGTLTQQQINYNIKLSKNRCIIEHSFGMLKQKFRQLYHIKLRKIPLIVHFVRAVCVLHNIAIKDELPDANLIETIEAENAAVAIGDDNEDIEDDGSAVAIRDHIAAIL